MLLERLDAEQSPGSSGAVRRRFDLMTEVVGLDRDRARAWTLARVLQNTVWELAEGATQWSTEPDRAIAEVLLAQDRSVLRRAVSSSSSHSSRSFLVRTATCTAGAPSSSSPVQAVRRPVGRRRVTVASSALISKNASIAVSPG